MNNYYAGERCLTKATKLLWENKPAPEVYPAQGYDPKPYTKPINLKHWKKKMIKVSEEEIENFQQQRLFAVIRNAEDMSA